MIKRIGLLIATALLTAAVVVVMAAPGFASPQSDECEAAGGTFSNPPGPGSSCIITEDVTPGKPKSPKAAKPFTETQTQTQPGQGGGSGNVDQRETKQGPTTNRGGNTVGG